ncbi:hypothetical protein V499_06932 [Pseudogymnoascus sp. VKM F-103]|uniref:Major facilitator superfamily (MFS) profile domain-containing protein n=1 Tax=Pseudogymnoascus verrucosus TaxID=342668 RepID=A0A1B8GEX6_9PEZI|nr:uncharacterized protein VE01_07714 [Pseudogymnoascus verrucosus]KFY72960.1 hypothetical protein V499_06932 [Pseudogymnoascus sp. VKM F-103]OBT94384.1 hypothetical protein VE01_07714 [Pseudogymnoascus verrucosus]
MAEKNTDAHVGPNGQPISASRRGSVSKSAGPFQTEIEDVTNVEMTDEQSRKVLRKIDLFLLPIMGFCYMLQFLDKGALAASTLLGILDPKTGIHLKGSDLAWCSGIFYFGYMAWSFPSAYFVVRLPIGRYLSMAVVLWGGILMTTAGCKSFTGLMIQRFFLGVAEAAVAPGFSLITGMFYLRKEQPVRQAGWFIGNCVALILGGLVSYGVLNIPNPAIPHWKLLFLIEGAVTVAYGVFMFFVLPDSVSTAWFLKPEERLIALARTLKNKTGIMDNGKFRWPQLWEALRDPQTWLLVLYTFCVNLPNGALTTFQPLIIKGMGFSSLKSILLGLPMGGVEIVFLVITSFLASYLRNARVLLMIFNTAVSMVGMVLVYCLDSQAGRMTGLVFTVVFAMNIPISLSLVTSNVAGFTKRSIVSSMLFVGYCVGNIVGPQFFLASEAPVYKTGLASALAGYSFSIFFLILLYLYYHFENKRRDKLYGSETTIDSDQELADELSNQTDRTITSFRYLL